MSFSAAEQERAIEAVTSLGWVPDFRHMTLSAHAIAEALSATQEEGRAILVALRDRELIEFLFQRGGGGSLEGVPMPVYRYGAWFRVDPVC
jgi:hypothetical protein